MIFILEIFLSYAVMQLMHYNYYSCGCCKVKYKRILLSVVVIFIFTVEKKNFAGVRKYDVSIEFWNINPA